MTLGLPVYVPPTISIAPREKDRMIDARRSEPIAIGGLFGD